MNTQQQLQTKELIYSTFSIISYLRDFFPESCYTTTKLCGVAIKNLKPSPHSGARKYIEWLEKGIYEAIDKKYLSVVIIGIYLKDPTKIVESYTFEINYNENNKKFGTESVSKMIKTLCLLVQSLQPLPNIKYVTVRLKYCDHVPINYDPPFFKPAQNDKLEFVSEPLKLDVGCATIGKEKTILKLQTLFDYSTTQNNAECDMKENDKSTNNMSQINTPKEMTNLNKNNQVNSIAILRDVTNNEKHTKDRSLQYVNSCNVETKNENNDTYEIQRNIACASMINKKDNNSTKNIVEPTKNTSVIEHKLKNTKNTKQKRKYNENTQAKNKKTNTTILGKIKNDQNEMNKGIMYIRKCLCGVNNDDGDMLQCDKCDAWMHTVCCGFFSNTDKRMPEKEYICDFCKKEFSLEYLRKIAMYRRALSVIYNEGFTTIDGLSMRLAFSVQCIKKIINKFIEEGFIVKDREEFVVIKNSETKAKIKIYFSLKVNKEKVSKPLEDIKCDCN
ncbi:hypothetical protein BDAP_002632 [Binucleata daphniae]